MTYLTTCTYTIYCWRTKQVDFGFHSLLLFQFCFQKEGYQFRTSFILIILVTPGERITSCYVVSDHWQKWASSLQFSFVKQGKSLLGIRRADVYLFSGYWILNLFVYRAHTCPHTLICTRYMLNIIVKIKSYSL